MMVSNQLPDSIEDLFTLGEDRADGCHVQKAATTAPARRGINRCFNVVINLGFH